MALISVCAISDARKVTGKVHCGKENISDVIVTDGVNFTTTKSNGSFKFDIADDARFVYIVTPSGYVSDYSSGAPEFYRSAAGCKSFDFDLTRTASPGQYTLFSISDPQVRNAKQLDQFKEKPLKDLEQNAKAYLKNGPVVGIMLGDVAWDYTELMPGYKDAVKSVGYPVYVVTGNHDYDKRLPFEEYPNVYYANFGPHNYAFFMGKDLVIGLNNIQYVAEKSYIEGYSDVELTFVKCLLKLIPAGTHIFIAQHSPIIVRDGKIDRADDMLALLTDYKVDFLSGHSHVMKNTRVSDNVTDHNAASIGGAWWVTDCCKDGTPRGYEVFNVSGDNISWHYHPIDFADDYQVEILKPGQSKFYPNCIVANIWDYDENWTVTWTEDGKDMGPMKLVEDVSPTYIREVTAYYESIDKPVPNFRKPARTMHYLIAEPNQYAEKVTVKVKSRFGQEWNYDVDMADYVDVQAHRGGAGLWPENTITSMTGAMNLGVNTLELDLQVSKDGKVVVSHDPYFASRYATRPDGTEVQPDDPKEYLYMMPYDSIAKYDVGKRPGQVWANKAQVPEIKPLATDLIDYVEKYVADHGLSPMRYNIEVKSKAKGEGEFWPEYHEFVDKCIELLLSKNLGDRLVVQCFDVRALNYMHEKYPQLKLSYLTSKKDTDWDAVMGKLNFIPTWISPEHSTLTQEFVDKCHDAGMKVVPWTPDTVEDIQRMIDLGVEAIISNYPDRLLQLTRDY